MAGHNKMLIDESRAHSYLISPMVKVLVGPGDSPKPFFVHEDLITSRSDFLRKALKKHGEGDKIVCTKGKEIVVMLPEVENAVFANYLYFLYQDQLPVHITIPHIASEPAKEHSSKIQQAADEEYQRLSDLYILCEMLQDRKGKCVLIAAFMEASVSKRTDGHFRYPPPQVIRAIYNGTPTHDPLRELFTSFYVYHSRPIWANEIAESDVFPHEFAHDVMIGMIKVRLMPCKPAIMNDAIFYSQKLRYFEEDPKVSA